MLRPSSQVSLIAALLLSIFATADGLFSVYDDLYSRPKFNVRYFDLSPISPEDVQGILDTYDKEDPTQEFGSFSIIRDGTGKFLSGIESKNSGEYLCHIPKVKSNETELEEESKISMEELEKNREQVKKDAMRIVNNSMSNFQRIVLGSDGEAPKINNCMYKTINYWTYEFCFNDSIKQFHEIFENGQRKKDPNVPSFIISKLTDESFQKVRLVDDFQSPGSVNLVQFANGGDVCDLTGANRMVDIKYVCDNEGTSNAFESSNEMPSISWFKEFKTCQYEMEVNIPELCQLKEFSHKTEEDINVIECNRIGKNVETDSDEYVIPRINIEDYDLSPIGMNFYAGIPKSVIGAYSDEEQKIDILISSDPSLLQFEQVKEKLDVLGVLAVNGIQQHNLIVNNYLFRSEGLKIEKGTQLVFSLKLYNFIGEYICSIRVERDEKDRISISAAYFPDGELDLKKNLMFYAKPEIVVDFSSDDGLKGPAGSEPELYLSDDLLELDHLLPEETVIVLDKENHMQEHDEL
ncbi:Yos9 protein [Saccharomycopsis crataegensis]|uniref:Endoplasmic reticulum lectin n=1 Tax=Saccharomycopsis crataegensis TaxID=43959 RepID=A0AAV5QUF4_9ASCO|nr:Yos9 protein [Saccharomycopsis crataegensis]